MKIIIGFFLFSLAFLSCKHNAPNGKFEISGEIKNLPDQKIFLEQIYFSKQPPEVLDTAEVKNGRFTLNGLAPEEGLYHLRLEKSQTDFIFINDQADIKFQGDANLGSVAGTMVNTRANGILKKLLAEFDTMGKNLRAINEKLDSLKRGDSTYKIEAAKREDLNTEYRDYIIRFIDTTSDPVVAMLALGNTQGIDPTLLTQSVSRLPKRFPRHKGLETMITDYNAYLSGLKQPKPVNTSRPTTGMLAPDFTMNDTDDKAFSLSQLKGKYVLVDFWASWCGPCRGENPNVVAAYNKFKDKNFTVLGVSLDEDKNKWLKAIKDDGLNWKHVSDLKQWNSLAVGLYGFDGIPYNVLLDPTGKIIATELRGEELQQKLDEVLK